MPLPKDFKFSDVTAVQTEAERRAAVMFGDDWMTSCLPSGLGGSPGIAAGNKLLSFSEVRIWGRTNTLLHDLDDGSPAHVEYSEAGELLYMSRHRDGVLSDAADGSPAMIQYYRSGAIHVTVRARNGYHLDLPDGTPAVIEYLYRQP